MFTSKSTLKLLSAACFGVAIVGCAADEPELADPIAVEFNSELQGMPPELADQVEADLEGAVITSVDVIDGDDGVLYEVTYIEDGAAKQRIYDRSGKRLAVGGPPSGGSPDANSGPIVQDARDMDEGGDGLGGGLDPNNDGKLNVEDNDAESGSGLPDIDSPDE